MRVQSTALPGVLVFEPAVHRDARGFFLETWRASRYRDAGVDLPFVQDNHSRSVQGTLRGLHYQIQQAQGKLVYAVTGSVYDVAVDLRRSSPTFGRWIGCTLTEENHLQLWVPPGFAHGFYVTSPAADVVYKCTDVYASEHERCLRWDDPDLAITWPLVGGAPPLLSPRDAAAPPLREAQAYP
ncbi:MAG TPA: dTDP-4-dehydrorhamnose 3,5-epimerase [Gemmatimonadales bacterium]